MSAFDLVVYLVGWGAGWVLLWQGRPLPRPTSNASARGTVRRSVAVVVPARNEAESLPGLLARIGPQLRAGDEVVVVDDHSDDATPHVARLCGARVVPAPPLPADWLGKPHACWVGVAATSASILLFIDADVDPASDLIDRIVVAVDHSPDAVVSVQPWHATRRFCEQASLLFNVTALMGCGAFTPFGRGVTDRTAFGPVLAVDRVAYEAAGGHAAPAVRAMHTEDIGLARAVGRAELHSGRPDTTFRMYPDGLRQTLDGWTRSIATGARFAPRWAALATLAWVASLAGGWLIEPWLYVASALQFWVLGRRAGSIHPLTAAAFPVAVAVFVAVFVRSLWRIVRRRTVTWKGRAVDARPS